jgi:hypothetical protein
MLSDLTGCRAVASWLPIADPDATAAWEADLVGVRTTLRIVRARDSYRLEVKADRGSGLRRVWRDGVFRSEAKARQAAAVLMRRTVQGRSLQR